MTVMGPGEKLTTGVSPEVNMSSLAVMRKMRELPAGNHVSRPRIDIVEPFYCGGETIDKPFATGQRSHTARDETESATRRLGKRER